MDGEVIKSFLVGLGFGVDDASLAKFNKAIASASLKVTALYATIQASAAGIFFSISKISEGFEEMGYSLRLVAPALNKFLLLRQAMLNAYKVAGVNLVKVVQQSILFNLSLAKTKFALEAIYKSVGARFLPVLTKQMDIFRQKIFANMPKIQAQLESFIKFMFKAFTATIQLGGTLWSILGRVYDFFKELDQATNGWSTKILGLIAVWKLLNLSFIATPLGALLTGLLSILALYDDFKVWQAGGKSYFNWTDALPTLEFIKTLLKQIGDIVVSIGAAVKNLFTGNWSGVISDLNRVASAFSNIGSAVDKLFKSFNIRWVDKLLQWRDKADASVASWFGSGGALSGAAAGAVNTFGGAGAAPTLSGALQPQPLVAPNFGSSLDQKINQENTYNIWGNNANDIGQTVLGSQSEAINTLIRNLASPVGR